MGKIIFAFFKSKAIESIGSLDEAMSFASPNIDKRQSNIFDNRDGGNEVEILEDEADFVGAKTGFFVTR